MADQVHRAEMSEAARNNEMEIDLYFARHGIPRPVLSWDLPSADDDEGIEYDRDFIVNNPIPAECVKCKRRFEDGPQYKEAIPAPTLDNVRCFYCHSALKPIDPASYAQRLKELPQHVKRP